MSNPNRSTSPIPDISIVVVSYNTSELLIPMRRAILASKGDLNLQTIVIDNASKDESVATLEREFSESTLICNKKNVGFGRANNQAVPLVTGRYVLLLNTDAFVASDTLSATVKYMDEHPECGILGTRLVGRDGDLQPVCRNFPNPWNVFLQRSGLTRFFPATKMVDEPFPNDDIPRECDWVVGCYLLVRRSVIEQCGLFDPRYFLYFEEVDFCKRAKRSGWKVIHFPSTTVIHLGGESAKSEGSLTPSGKQISALQIESELLYYRKHFGLTGLLAFVCLSWLTDLIHGIKWLARGQGIAGLDSVRAHATAVRTILLNTHLGTAPTR
ncbi:MAG: glycosyltransferase family 2 protein [Herminiimonas sp.]|nr:glycosyltransferase family 2 protein [Herminiimonas sp.]